MLGEEDSQNGHEHRSRSKLVKILLSRQTLETVSRGPSKCSCSPRIYTLKDTEALLCPMTYAILRALPWGRAADRQRSCQLRYFDKTCWLQDHCLTIRERLSPALSDIAKFGDHFKTTPQEFVLPGALKAGYQWWTGKHQPLYETDIKRIDVLIVPKHLTISGYNLSAALWNGWWCS